tara:strand:+ start:268 stop:660 length:393 start_codon:yes stop_codon:yes gene_type:complete
MGQWVSSNHNHADEYMGSSLPFAYHFETVGATVQELNFPYVTRHITIINNGSKAVRVGFTENGVNSNPNPNFIVVKAGTSSPRLEIKCQKIFLVRDGDNCTDISVLAGYTNIPKNRFLNLTGSEGFEGVG